MSLRKQAAPPSTNYPKVNIFVKEDFNEALWENGYDVILEEAVACPCKGQSADSRVTCSNCLGTGWVFVNPIETRALVMSINRNTKYKDWSPEYIGTVSVTFMRVNRFGFMDKITLTKNYGSMSEILEVRPSTDPNWGSFVFGTYKFVELNSVFVFTGDNTNLLKLSVSDYRINPANSYVVDIKTSSLPAGFNGKISVSYKHRITYNIIDIPHDLRITKEYSLGGKRTVEEMPIQAVARKSQYELGASTNYSGNNILNNSYL